MDFDVARAKELIAQREEIDTELKAIFGASTDKANGTRKPQACSLCGQTGHSARSCPTKQRHEELPALS